MKEDKQSCIVKYVKAAIIPILFLIIWEYAGRTGKIDVSILCMPSKIWDSWMELWQKGKYQTYLLVSLGRFLKGFLLGTAAGLCLGTLLGLSKRVRVYLSPVTSLLRPIPLLAWVPIVILSLGVGEFTKTFLIAIGCFWEVFLNTMDGIKGVDLKYIEVAEVLEKRRMTTILHVVFPAAFPSIVTGLRAGFGNSWKSIVASEMIGASSGIGFIISYARETSRADLMYIGLVTIAIIGLILDIILIHVQDLMLNRYFGRQ